MKPSSFFNPLSLLLFTILFATPLSPALAATSNLITNWSSPAPYSYYSNSSEVHVVGTYSIPAGWSGDLYIWQDGVMLTWLTNKGSVGDHNYYSNITGGAALNGSFDINIGKQPSATPHSIFLEMFAAKPCYLLGNCPDPNATNYADEKVVPRSYTDAISDDPILSVSYNDIGTMPLQEPAFNFANVVVNTPDQRPIYIRNVGGGTANITVSISGSENPFYVIGTKSFAIPAGVTVGPIPIQYYPQVTGDSSGQLNISCAPVTCASVQAGLIGNSVTSGLPPIMTLSVNQFNFGRVNTGSFGDLPVTIANNGGGMLSGDITFGGDPSYSCSPSCHYDVAGGNPVTITVHFAPTTDGSHDTTASFSGAQGGSIDVTGSGNSKPLIQINCPLCSWATDGVHIDNYYDQNAIAPGQPPRYVDVQVWNDGKGALSGDLDIQPQFTTDGWSCYSVDGVVVDATHPCTFSGITPNDPPTIVTLKFTPSAAAVGGLHDFVSFRNLSNPPDEHMFNMYTYVTIDAMLGIYGTTGGVYFTDTVVDTVKYTNVPGDSTSELTLSNLGPTPLRYIVNYQSYSKGFVTCAVCNGIHTLSPTGVAGDTQDIVFAFAPVSTNPSPTGGDGGTYQICIVNPDNSTTCLPNDPNPANWPEVWGRSVAPHLSVHPVIPGVGSGAVGDPINTDTLEICAGEYEQCVFSGTKTVYYGEGTNVTSGTFTDGVYCSNTNDGGPFVNPLPNINKHCWIANDDHGSWVGRPWTTASALSIANDGDGLSDDGTYKGGAIEYQIVNAANFGCDPDHLFMTPCSGHVSNVVAGTDIDHPTIYFNPDLPSGLKTQQLAIAYDFVGTPGEVHTDCPGNAHYCHTMTLNFSGTGLSGPHFSYLMGTFPLTNVNSITTAKLKVMNNGTAPITGATVTDGDATFWCSANCGPQDIAVGASFDATISFHPLSVGLKSGHVKLTSTDALVAPITVPLSASGNNAPVIAILQPVLGSLDYGPVNEGSERISGDFGPSSAIIVTNTGAGFLTGDVTVVGGLHFACSTSYPSPCHYGPLANGETKEIKISFAPKDLGPLSDSLSFSGGSNNPTFTVKGSGELGASSLTSFDANFGRVVIRPGNYKEQLVTVKNLGSVDLPGGDITLSGPFTCTHPPTPFNAVTGKCSYPAIVAGGTVQFTIRFTPVVPGTANGIITLTGSAFATIRLSGIGVVPSVKFKEK